MPPVLVVRRPDPPAASILSAIVSWSGTGEWIETGCG